MKTKTLATGPDAAGVRLDVWLSSCGLGLTRAAAVRVIEQGGVLINGKAAKKNCRLSGGEQITLTMPDARPIKAVPQQIPLDIVYEDDMLLVINKPRGMVVHPAPGSPDKTLVNALLAHCGSLSGVGGDVRPGIVHRLDKDTSGLLIVAKCDEAHLALSAQLKDRTLTRIYEAVVRGNVKQDEGLLDFPIGRSPRDRKKMAVVAGGRRAITEYRVLSRMNGYTHLLCKLHTGRTHQIRVHMAHIGHPVAGDLVYGGKGDKSGLEGQCLHARQIEFVHPGGGWSVKLSTPLPEHFQRFLDKICVDL